MKSDQAVAEYVVAPATAEEIPALPAIESRAASIFSADVLPPEVADQVSSVAELLAAQREGRVLVARETGGRVMGFALVESLDGDGVLHELDVDPSDGRRGIGSSLIEAACEWAIASGHSRIVLSTFRDVEWNGPFYSRQGFREIPRAEWTPALLDMREAERAMGLDTSDRILMARELRSD